MPLGIYRKSLEEISRGQIIGACVPEQFALLAKKRGYLSPGFCFSQLRPVMKYVAAITGDSVEVRLDKTLVNGRILNDSPLILKDSNNRQIPNQLGKHKLKPGEYWLFSNHHHGSLDSRYFGPVKETLFVVKPLLTLNQLCKINFIKNITTCNKEKVR